MGETTVVAELREACAGDRCPVCALVLRSERRFLDALIYEQVNDIGGREVLRANRGFCMRHSAMLASIPSALGSSIITWDVLRELQRVVARAGGPGDESGGPLRWLRQRGSTEDRLADQLGPSGHCPACERAGQMEQVYVTGLLELLGDQAFDVSFNQSMGLCLPHLQQALRLRSTERARATLLAHQVASWHNLELHLEEFIRKSDYRYTGTEQPTEEERAAWKRALRLLTGWRDEQ